MVFVRSVFFFSLRDIPLWNRDLPFWFRKLFTYPAKDILYESIRDCARENCCFKSSLSQIRGILSFFAFLFSLSDGLNAWWFQSCWIKYQLLLLPFGALSPFFLCFPVINPDWPMLWYIPALLPCVWLMLTALII